MVLLSACPRNSWIARSGYETVDPLTAEHSKPALHFANGYRIVDFVLSNLANSGIDTVYVLAQYKPEGPELVARLRREHDDIRRKRQELADCLRVAEGLEGGAPPMVVLDVLGYGWDLWELLDNHAHVESRALHECLAQSLPAATPGRA